MLCLLLNVLHHTISIRFACLLWNWTGGSSTLHQQHHCSIPSISWVGRGWNQDHHLSISSSSGSSASFCCCSNVSDERNIDENRSSRLTRLFEIEGTDNNFDFSAFHLSAFFAFDNAIDEWQTWTTGSHSHHRTCQIVGGWTYSHHLCPTLSDSPPPGDRDGILLPQEEEHHHQEEEKSSLSCSEWSDKVVLRLWPNQDSESHCSLNRVKHGLSFFRVRWKTNYRLRDFYFQKWSLQVNIYSSDKVIFRC